MFKGRELFPKGGNYVQMEETIFKWRKLFKGGNYIQREGTISKGRDLCSKGGNYFQREGTIVGPITHPFNGYLVYETRSKVYILDMTHCEV